MTERETIVAEIAAQKAVLSATNYKVIEAFERFLAGETAGYYIKTDRLSEWQKLWNLEKKLEQYDKDNNVAPEEITLTKEGIMQKLKDTEYMIVEAMEARIHGRLSFYRQQRLKLWQLLWEHCPEERSQMRVY